MANYEKVRAEWEALTTAPRLDEMSKEDLIRSVRQLFEQPLALTDEIHLPENVAKAATALQRVTGQPHPRRCDPAQEQRPGQRHQVTGGLAGLKQLDIYLKSGQTTRVNVANYKTTLKAGKLVGLDVIQPPPAAGDRFVSVDTDQVPCLWKGSTTQSRLPWKDGRRLQK